MQPPSLSLSFPLFTSPPLPSLPVHPRLICLYLNTLPGHVVVKLWDIILWFNGSIDIATNGTEDGSNSTSTSAPNGHGAHTASGGASGGVLLWVATSILNGLSSQLLECHDFESLIMTVRKGTDKVGGHARLGACTLVRSRACVVWHTVAREGVWQSEG